MLTYSFTNIGSDSLYHHLYQCIREDILCGNLTAETKLPSKRSFAKNLGVSNITVENAYAQLQAEGYIYSIPKKGFYVRNLSDLTLSISQTTSPTSNSLRMPDKYKVDLASNQMNPEQFPFSVWSKLIRETLLNRHVELMQTPPWGGVWDLRHAICSQLKDFRGMDVTPEQIIIGAGTEYLYGLLIQLFGQDKVYAVENPGYHKIAKIYENSRVKYRYIPISAKGIDALELESSGAQIVHLSPSHHFPTGIVTPIGTRYELLAWATRQPGRYIIEDDYDSEFRLSGKPIPTLQSIDQSERVIYMNTFTKSLSSTIRISYMVLPKHLLEQFAKRLSFYSCTVSNIPWICLSKKDISKNILTVCVLIIAKYVTNCWMPLLIAHLPHIAISQKKIQDFTFCCILIPHSQMMLCLQKQKNMVFTYLFCPNIMKKEALIFRHIH